MTFFKIFLALLISLIHQVDLVERNHFCEEMVVQECKEHSKGLLTAIENGNRRLVNKECEALQASNRVVTRHMESEIIVPGSSQGIRISKF